MCAALASKQRLQSRRIPILALAQVQPRRQMPKLLSHLCKGTRWLLLQLSSMPHLQSGVVLDLRENYQDKKTEVPLH